MADLHILWNDYCNKLSSSILGSYNKKQKKEKFFFPCENHSPIYLQQCQRHSSVVRCTPSTYLPKTICWESAWSCCEGLSSWLMDTSHKIQAVSPVGCRLVPWSKAEVQTGKYYKIERFLFRSLKRVLEKPPREKILTKVVGDEDRKVVRYVTGFSAVRIWELYCGPFDWNSLPDTYSEYTLYFELCDLLPNPLQTVY